jgi:primosomal protein N'
MFADILFPINAEAFTYRIPEELQADIKVGCRVQTPFKRSFKVGIVVNLYSKMPLQHTPLVIGGQKKGSTNVKKAIAFKEIRSVLDEEPFIPRNILKLINWAGQYYMSTPGLALKNAVPSAFFSGKKAGKSRIIYDEDVKKEGPFNLTVEQSRALREITNSEKGIFLLHGVTGSGKTEIYMRAIQSLPEEKEAIFLVPEIAITAQMIDRFRSRFGDKAVFYHSGLSIGERITQWQKMRKGEIKVVIGVRSAVFAPFRNVGLIVIDEEQEASYKQFEGLRYNARDVALARAQLEGIKIILGSATPSMEAYYASQKGKFKYIELKKRIEQRPLPDVAIIDMTKEEKHSFSLSRLRPHIQVSFMQYHTYIS